MTASTERQLAGPARGLGGAGRKGMRKVGTA